MKRRYALGAVLLALLVAATLYLSGGGRSPAGQPPLRKVTPGNIAEITKEFNAAKDEVRVLLLLSPT